MTLCETFRRLSLDTWKMIESSRRTNFQLKEETVTDLNILALKSRHPRQIATTVFSKRAESRNGADWEWWFRGTSKRWIGFRVQAKIVNIQTDTFEHLHYRTAAGLYQCDRLISNALGGPHPTIPLYCLYIQTGVPTHLTNWSCGSSPFLKDFYGCSITSALTIKRLRPRKKSIADIQDYLRPWHCLVCCKKFGQADLITNIQEYVRAQFEVSQVSAVPNLDTIMPRDFSTDRPPTHVLATLEGHSNDVSPPDDQIYGVVVYDEEGSIPRHPG